MPADLDTTILWLEGRAEYHSAEDFIEHLSSPTQSKHPVWHEFICQGSQVHLERLLNVISTLPQPFRKTIFNLSLNNDQKFSYFIAARSAPPCAIAFLKAIEDFTHQDKWELFSSRSTNGHVSFMTSLISNPFNDVFPLFIEQFKSLTIEAQLSLLKQINSYGEPVPTLIASNKRGDLYRDFLIFVHYFSGLLQQFYGCYPPICKEEVYSALFQTDKELKQFYQTILEGQSISSIFYMIEQEMVPVKHTKYLGKARRNLWNYIKALPLAKQLLILTELEQTQGAFSPLFLEYGGVLDYFERLKWRKEIDDRTALVYQQSDSDMSSETSYSRINQQLPPVIAQLIDEDSQDLHSEPFDVRDKTQRTVYNNEEFYEVPLHYPEPSAPNI
jgi:hypothetical protein